MTHKAIHKQIRFNQHWNNKLFGHFFTTIRKPSDYYVTGEVYDVILCNNKVGTATLIRQTLTAFHLISEHLLTLDTGYEPVAARKIFATMFSSKVNDLDSTVFVIMIFQMNSGPASYLSKFFK